MKANAPVRWLCRLVRRRLARSCCTSPTLAQWGGAALLLAAFAFASVPFGLASGLLKYSPTDDSAGSLLLFAAVAFALPSLAEEVLFRAVLLPHPSEKAPPRWLVLQAAVAVSAFVAWHPLGGWLFAPWARPLFYDAAFLALCALFGAVSSMAYLRTGSIWPSVAMHWIIVVSWKLWFGGWITALGQPSIG